MPKYKILDKNNCPLNTSQINVTSDFLPLPLSGSLPLPSSIFLSSIITPTTTRNSCTLHRSASSIVIAMLFGLSLDFLWHVATLTLQWHLLISGLLHQLTAFVLKSLRIESLIGQIHLSHVTQRNASLKVFAPCLSHIPRVLTIYRQNSIQSWEQLESRAKFFDKSPSGPQYFYRSRFGHDKDSLYAVINIKTVFIPDTSKCWTLGRDGTATLLVTRFLGACQCMWI